MNQKTSLIRINKYLAHLGLASRRTIDLWVQQKKIVINGKVVTEPGTKINPQTDQIEVSGKPVTRAANPVYILLNKPSGYTTTAKDRHAKKTVLDLVPISERVYPVGRLDRESRGLVLLTNDGELTFRLTHPKYHVPKIYEVLILGQVPESKLDQMRKGIQLEEGMTAPAEVKVLKKIAKHTMIQIILTEGKKRQIRRMAAALHLHIIDLCRVSMGLLMIEKLKEGKWRRLSKEEVIALKQSVQLL